MPDHDDDAITLAAVAAGAATAVTHLQLMTQGLGEDLGVATAEKSGPTSLGEQGVLLLEFEDDDDASEEADPRPTKHTRLSYPRPNYGASAWGLMLETMRALHKARQLQPACDQAAEFRRRFRVPYEFFLLLVEVVKPWFGNVTQDVARRDCVPVTLKVRYAVCSGPKSRA